MKQKIYLECCRLGKCFNALMVSYNSEKKICFLPPIWLLMYYTNFGEIPSRKCFIKAIKEMITM